MTVPSTAEFRSQLVAWLDENDLTPPDGDDSLDAHQAQHLRVLKALYDAGWMRYGWPESAGGLGGPDILRAIVGEEIVGRGIDHPGPYSMLDVLTPTMIDYARPQLAAEMVPRLLSGQESWCQGFSEPGSGSDLASLTTRAVQDGDKWIVNGQKVWTSFARYADWCMLLVRTDVDAPKHKGITFLLVDMKSPGITVRPLRQITGEAEFNETFLENVRVPAANVVGEVNAGWSVTVTTLAYERDLLTMIRHISLRTALERLVALAKRTERQGRPVGGDPVMRQKLAELLIAERCLQLNGYRSLTRVLRGVPPGPEGSTAKLFWSQVDQDLAEIATQVIGPYSQLTGESALAPDEGQWQFYALLARGSGIRAGTSEILRNILGERVLGLPKD